MLNRFQQLIQMQNDMINLHIRSKCSDMFEGAARDEMSELSYKLLDLLGNEFNPEDDLTNNLDHHVQFFVDLVHNKTVKIDTLDENDLAQHTNCEIFMAVLRFIMHKCCIVMATSKNWNEHTGIFGVKVFSRIPKPANPGPCLHCGK